MAHRLAGHFAQVNGRAYADPARMKPNPEPISRAVQALGVLPSRAILVGDSLSDIDGARAAGVRVIAYANRPHKVEAFQSADLVITSMGPLAEALVRRWEQADEQESLSRGSA